MRLFELKDRMLEIANLLEDPFLEVRVILSYLGFSPIDQITKRDEIVSEDRVKKAINAIKKRANGTPLAYITHEKEFYGHSFYVDENVLIPRPDTEIIVEKAIEEYKRNSYKGKILDLCSGSGAIASSISFALDKDVYFSDISPFALAIGKENYERITKRKAHCRLGDLFSPWEDEKFSLIATNPPYLTDSWYKDVAIEVKKEPQIALIGFGRDGLDIIKKIISSSVYHLEKNGTLLIECDYRQANDISSLMERNGFLDTRIAKDLAGKDRVVYGIYKG